MLIVYFFWVAILLLLWKIIRQYHRKEISANELFVWVFFWIAVGFGVFFARKLDVVSQFLGVERAIDLLVYVAVAVLFYLVYRIYTKIERIEKNITKIVRIYTLKEDKEDKDT